jgi:UDP-glucose:(heptosyl)LPS alpha-1,3-glucosyltransferase
MDELIRRGHTIEAFSSEWEETEGVRVHRVKASGPSFLRPLLFALRVRNEVERARPDVVISLERTFSQDIYRAGDGCHKEWLLRRLKTASPIKRLFIRLNPLHMVLLYIERRMFADKRLKTVVANSERGKEEIIRHYGLPEDSLCVIYNGINASEVTRVDAVQTRKRIRAECGISEGTVVLLFVGSGFERKGLKYLIRALAVLKKSDPDIRLLVVGKGRTAGYVKEAERLGVSGNVVFKGPVKGALDYYPASDVFVLPSIYEPFSNACLEALASGLPVVTSAINGASEVLTEGVNGASVKDPADHEEIAGKISIFLDAQKRSEAAPSAKAEAEKHTIEGNVNEFLRLMESIRVPVAEESGVN